jgi:hypothetical protein
MPGRDPRLEKLLAQYAEEVKRAVGPELVSLVVYGSAAGDEWIRGRSDVNTMIVVRALSSTILDALARRLRRWRRSGFALPVVVEEEFFERSRDVFPMELDDARRAHRTLVGPDPLADVIVDRADLRRECEREARGKLLRLRALYLDVAESTDDLERLLVEALKTFLVILRHVLHLRGENAPYSYADVLTAGEHLLGPLPAFRRVLDHRTGERRLARRELRAEFARYLADAERVVAAVDATHA